LQNRTAKPDRRTRRYQELAGIHAHPETAGDTEDKMKKVIIEHNALDEDTFIAGLKAYLTGQCIKGRLNQFRVITENKVRP